MAGDPMIKKILGSHLICSDFLSIESNKIKVEVKPLF